MSWVIKFIRTALASIFALGATSFATAVAQDRPRPPQASEPQASEPGVRVPQYWDIRRRPEVLDLSPIRVVRFLVDPDYPPFHFATPDGGLSGFSVDLARALCEQLKVACTVQARRWDTLADSLAEGRGDAIIAAMTITPALRERFAVTAPYHRSPGRFVSRLDPPRAEQQPVSPAALAGIRVAVVAGSAHEAFLADLFPGAQRVPFRTIEDANAALMRGETRYLFGDGVTLALWLNGREAGNCCAFAGGPYLEPRYFGDGIGIVVRREDTLLRRALDQGLQSVAMAGVYADLYLKYFPVGFY